MGPGDLHAERIRRQYEELLAEVRAVAARVRERAARLREAFPEDVQPAAQPAPGRPDGGGEASILLAEDDRAVRQLCRMTLLAAGFEVIEAANGAEALRKAQGHPGPIDLLLSDAVLPDVAGPELAARLRAQRPGLKVLFVAGSPPGADLRGEALLETPFTLPELTRRARAMVTPRDRPGVAGPHSPRPIQPDE